MPAHNDRRPVDPPPVVELRIIEGESIETGKDITFDYNAQFFLFASLEKSRPMAHGRVQTAATTSPPILNGTCCSGMAYLDRPISAGYFIFPDLSVRHEGFYHLNFNLYETTKEAKDLDADLADADLPPGSDFRMEITTHPFEVYSAKKFPGLTESTLLSRAVAEQGCRVRIRRDVRMRKREGKGRNNNFSRREEELAARPGTQPQNSEDPHTAAARARSQSNSSDHRLPYGPEPHRRPSAAESYHHPSQPAYDNPSAPPGRHLTFGSESTSTQYAAPRQPVQHGGQQLTPVSPGGPYTPSGSSFPGYQPIRPLSRNGTSMHQDGHERRRSSQQVPLSPSPYSQSEAARRDSLTSYPATPVSAHAPPMHTSGPLRHEPRAPGPMNISALVSPIIEPQTEPDAPLPDVRIGGKRKHEDTFVQSTSALHNRQREPDMHLSNRSYVYKFDTRFATYESASGQKMTRPFNEFVA